MSLKMLLAEGLDAVFARHPASPRACAAAVAAWGLKLVRQAPELYSTPSARSARPRASTQPGS
jgi:alanine-glyoxylate transaminase/serine-glyoxylate transaminase/serine-pyruvate transaminase